MADLHDLARAAGVQIDWRDANGRDQRVSDEAIRRLLTALGHDADSDTGVARSLDALGDRPLARFASADAGALVRLPRGVRPGRADLVMEDGATVGVTIDSDGEDAVIGPINAIGYHDLHVDDAVIRLAVAPWRCPSIRDLTSRARIWGPAVQIPSLRDTRATDYGDFTTLASAARGFAAAGADALAISPVHALFPGDPSRFSPYAPSSRLFLNVLLADPALMGEAVASGGSGDLIDWQGGNPRRMAALRRAFADRARFADDIADFTARGGGELERHATFDALFDHFLAEGAWGWQQWPDAYRDPAGPAVVEFAQAHREAVDFYLFAQWLAARGLDAAQKAARDAGMGLGLIADLAVGMDAGGSHAWSRPQELLTGLSIGAPPDILGPDGQNWGITGFRPDALLATGFDAFIATIRAALDHAGGLRIDHALGLRRLWVVPEGASAAEGAYLTYPLDHMLRILAIEAERARALVIGEDLGTVPEGLRDVLEARHALGMRVLWFERQGERFAAPRDWQPQAVAMTGTHDLPTVAGWWRGRDIDWTWSLGRSSQAESEGAERATRAADREQLWRALVEAGTAEGPQPGEDDAAAVVDAACAYVARTPSELAILPMEDVVGASEAPNLPGTTDEHPNWRRRMPDTTDAMLARPDVERRIARVNEARE